MATQWRSAAWAFWADAQRSAQKRWAMPRGQNVQKTTIKGGLEENFKKLKKFSDTRPK